MDGPEEAARSREDTHFVRLWETDMGDLLNSCTEEDKNTRLRLSSFSWPSWPQHLSPGCMFFLFLPFPDKTNDLSSH